MDNSSNVYATPESDLQEASSAEKKGWKLLAIWTVILLVINIFLAFVFTAYKAEFKSLDILLSYVIGNTLGIPVIVLLISQIWEKHRNGRSRVKAVLYPSYLVLLSQGASFFSILNEIAKQAN